MSFLSFEIKKKTKEYFELVNEDLGKTEKVLEKLEKILNREKFKEQQLLKHKTAN